VLYQQRKQEQEKIINDSSKTLTDLNTNMQATDLVLATHIPYSKANIFIFHSLHIKSCITTNISINWQFLLQQTKDVHKGSWMVSLNQIIKALELLKLRRIATSAKTEACKR